MQTVPTKFLRSMVALRRIPDTYTMISECTLIHDARNEFASYAIIHGFDRVLWLDSDMTFPDDLLIRLNDTMDRTGAPMVTALCFKRVLPTVPVIYSDLRRETDDLTGATYIKPTIMTDYPRSSVFPVAACGFGAVLTEVSLLKDVWDKYGIPPFAYHMNLGEDLSFCWRVRQSDRTILCDSNILTGHVGTIVFGEDTYLGQVAAGQATPSQPAHQPNRLQGHGHSEDSTVTPSDGHSQPSGGPGK